MNCGELIKKNRIQMGYSQSELAIKAGVGLATLQNIEADRANPSIKTLRTILKVLHIEIRFESTRRKADRKILLSLGLPLMGDEEGEYVRTRARLLTQLQTLSFADFKGRELRALSSWLHAIRDHYPSFWEEVPARLKAWSQNQQVSPKLRRLALARLGSYL
jgi:transcriptional regulator with XRE-family HTH domain